LFVVEDGGARGRIVKAGARAGARIEILSGLNAGEMVIVNPPRDLSDGARVEVRP
jgi:HlyD family secretion protein